MPLVASRFGLPIIAAMSVHARAIFSMASRVELMNSSLSSKSWGKAPQTDSSGNTISSALAVCAWRIAEIIFSLFPEMSSYFKIELG